MPKTIIILAIVFLVVSFLGFLDATFLAVETFLGKIPPCSITGGCESVLTSPYSKFLGLPVAVYGALYYLIIFIFAAYFLDTKKEKALKLAAKLTPLGLLASVYFVFLQAFVIKQYCPYCLVSAGTSTILFVLGLFIFKSLKTKQ